uniref:Uncharacterized protein n=1 Tax=Panagrellus redivivus TaxID=6233 RepID=A0A7E4VUY9_PANRE
MQWLWRVTKPIRDELENPHFMVQGHIYEPLALKVRILQRKLVRMFSFPTSPVFAPFPTSTTVDSITPIEELACDRMLESEDELVPHVHYATPSSTLIRS